MKEYLNRLVVAARDLMAGQGLDNATVQDVTDAADVGKGTFFSYFRSKQGNEASQASDIRGSQWTTPLTMSAAGQV